MITKAAVKIINKDGHSGCAAIVAHGNDKHAWLDVSRKNRVEYSVKIDPELAQLTIDALQEYLDFVKEAA